MAQSFELTVAEQRPPSIDVEADQKKKSVSERDNEALARVGKKEVLKVFECNDAYQR